GTCRVGSFNIAARFSSRNDCSPRCHRTADYQRRYCFQKCPHGRCRLSVLHSGRTVETFCHCGPDVCHQFCIDPDRLHNTLEIFLLGEPDDRGHCPLGRCNVSSACSEKSLGRDCACSVHDIQCHHIYIVCTDRPCAGAVHY